MAFTVRVSGKLEEIVREAKTISSSDVAPDQAHRATLLAFAQTAFYMLAVNLIPLSSTQKYTPNVDDPSTWDIEMVDDDSLN